MARKPMITRTIQTTHATFLCADTVSAEMCNKTVALPRTYKDEKALLKAGRNVLETETFKVVSVVDTTIREELYGMSEDKFIAQATLLDPKTRKELEDVTEYHTVA